jgi:hypothetical protein
LEDAELGLECRGTHDTHISSLPGNHCRRVSKDFIGAMMGFPPSSNVIDIELEVGHSF